MMKEFELYDKDGWVNIPAIAATGAWMIIIIGPRQVGKTFGVIKYFLDNDIRHIYARRTKAELEACVDDPRLNPYLKMKECGYDVNMVKASKYTWMIGDVDQTSEKVKIVSDRGIGVGLMSIGSIRGFSGDGFTDYLLDEFIPEHSVITRGDEGLAYFNSIITISGNRELQGKPPLRCWLLANSNTLSHPTLARLKLIPVIERMQRTGKEWQLIERGNGKIFIALPRSEQVMDKRKETAFLSYLSETGGGKFYDMAVNNQFAFNNFQFIKPKSVKGYKPYLRMGEFYVWEKNNESLYICRTPGAARGEEYEDTEDDKRRIQLLHPEIMLMYNWQRVTFSDAEVLFYFKDYMGIKK